MGMNNQLLTDFTNQLERRFGHADLSLSYSDWICKHTTLKRKPFRFNQYQFQKDITDDDHPDLWCIKCSQVGLSEIQIRKSLAFITRVAGSSVIYTYPNERMYKKEKLAQTN